MKLVILLIFVFTQSVFSAQRFIGTWKLERIEHMLNDESIAPFCSGEFGHLIYTEAGYVSVAISCGEKVNINIPEIADQFNRRYFYTGKYSLENSTIRHFVLQSDQKKIIGKELSKEFEINSLRLLLKSNVNGISIHAYWKKVNKD